MIMITSFANPRIAQAFVDYMQTLNINLVIQQDKQTDIWLSDESKEQQVRAELKRFLENLDDPRYQAASWSNGQSNVAFSYKRYPFFATLTARAGPFTLIMMAVCVVLFGIMSITGYPPFLYTLGWPITAEQHYQVWRYFTHSLLQFSFLQLIFNLLWWWYLGGTIEKNIGSGKLITLTLIASLLSGFMQTNFAGPLFGGLSGTVFALMGYVWLRDKRDPEGGLQVQNGLLIFAIIWLVIEYFTRSIVLPAHLTGFLVGLAMALGDTLNLRKRT